MSIKTPAQNRASWRQRAARNLERAMQMPRLLCECGCGESILALKSDGSRRRYADGHNARRTPVISAGPGFPQFSQPGRCAESWVDPEWFWADPKDSDTRDDAKRVCLRCPVRDECLQWAREHREPGIWGGLTEEERSGRRTRERKAAA